MRLCEYPGVFTAQLHRYLCVKDQGLLLRLAAGECDEIKYPMYAEICRLPEIERFHIFTRLIYVWQKRVAWRFVRVLGHGPNGFYN